MKNDFMIKAKKILMYITLIWSSIMLVIYLIVLFDIPLFALISHLPLGELISDILVALLLLGIWVVPVLYVIMIILMVLVRIKHKEENQNIILSISTVMLPVVLAVLMLLTDFNDLLS